MELKEIMVFGLSCIYYIDKDSVNFHTFRELNSNIDEDSILLLWK